MSYDEYKRLAGRWLRKAERLGHPRLSVGYDFATGAVWMSLQPWDTWHLDTRGAA